MLTASQREDSQEIAVALDIITMKKPILITALIVTILIILGVWVYFFLYGTQENTDGTFARFGIGGERGDVLVPAEDTRIDVGDANTGLPQKLRQLTTRPVAGASFDAVGIRYVEQGTGHIYHINLQSGVETIISGTTIPHTAHAIFSKEGNAVIITSRERNENNTIVGTIITDPVTGGTVAGVSLPKGAHEIAFSSASNTVNYLLDTEAGSAGYAYNMLKKVSVQVFSSPLRDIRVLWGEPLYVYTTPTAFQKGNLYRVVENELVYTSSGGEGLMASRYDEGVVITKTAGGNSLSTARTHSGEETKQAFPFIPEKCVANPTKTQTVYCATPSNRGKEIFPDDWYKGTLSYNDLLWSLDIKTGGAIPLSDFKTESGREIDVMSIGTDSDGGKIWLINKNDNTLWMFDTNL